MLIVLLGVELWFSHQIRLCVGWSGRANDASIVHGRGTIISKSQTCHIWGLFICFLLFAPMRRHQFWFLLLLHLGHGETSAIIWPCRCTVGTEWVRVVGRPQFLQRLLFERAVCSSLTWVSKILLRLGSALAWVQRVDCSLHSVSDVFTRRLGTLSHAVVFSGGRRGALCCFLAAATRSCREGCTVFLTESSAGRSIDLILARVLAALGSHSFLRISLEHAHRRFTVLVHAYRLLLAECALADALWGGTHWIFCSTSTVASAVNRPHGSHVFIYWN